MALYAHGRWDIDWSDNIMVVELRNAFNVEGANLATKQIKSLALAHQQAPWKQLVKLCPDFLGCPRTVAIFQNIDVWSYEHGRIAGAVVVHNSLQAYVYQQVETDTKIFYCQTQANNWICPSASLVIEPKDNVFAFSK